MKRIYKRLFAMVLTIAIAIPIFVVPISAVQTPITTSTSWTKEDCIEIKDYISENFATFVAEYNTAFPEDKFIATGIEYWTLIHLVEDDNVGLYLDFDGDNGYFVGTGDYKIYELHTVGDLPELKNETNIHFSYYDGFLYMDKSLNLQKYSDLFDNRDYDVQSKFNGDSMMNKSSRGDWGTLDIESYINQHYPDYEYVTHNTYLSVHLTPTTQMATSYYVKRGTNASGSTTSTSKGSEGNCALHTMYQTMVLWANMSFINIFPSSTVNLNQVVLMDPLYNEYGVGTPKVNNGEFLSNYSHYKWVVHTDVLGAMPVLYHRIRSYALTEDYKPVGGYGKFVETMEYVANIDYGQNISVHMTTSESAVIESLDDYKAVVLWAYNTEEEASHAMTIVGYREYSYEEDFLIFNITKYAHFYMVADGHTDVDEYDESYDAQYVYYDPYINSTEYYYVLD